MELGEPHRIEGDVRVSFRGEGRARFRLQHTRDRDGRPDELGWCDASDLSDAINGGVQATHGMIRTMMVDSIEGDRELSYHRFRADWLRVVPHDQDEVGACQRYSIEISPLPNTSSG